MSAQTRMIKSYNSQLCVDADNDTCSINLAFDVLDFVCVVLVRVAIQCVVCSSLQSSGTVAFGGTFMHMT